jgi:hypothetical protein
MLLAEVTPLKRPGTKTKLIHRRVENVIFISFRGPKAHGDRSESGEDGEDLVEFRDYARLYGKR